ncbi:hypothetical protein EXIGLDRAFT_835649 [Exidia glandulosa HHB12029]|uniref:Uncharacterized protein n=1 Tax=Exidia glandulosa HHB12029 TaxID=1314781 RepID=A0A165IIX2_EXIGL|nr:hypothetical protein EXIGLDRAFT_835649 [Exidia glandulosa HHB12029]
MYTGRLKRTLADPASEAISAKRVRPLDLSDGPGGGNILPRPRKCRKLPVGPRISRATRRNAFHPRVNATAIPQTPLRASDLDFGHSDESTTQGPSVAWTALSSEAMTSIKRDFPGLATAIDNYEDTGCIDIADFDLRFRLNDYRPSHGGFYHPFAGDASGTRIGSLKGDMVRAIHESRGGYHTSPASSDMPLDYMFTALACGTYGNSVAPDALVFALSRHYPVQTLSSSHLEKSDAEVLRILRAAEKYGYRVSLTQLELSHFGNPSNRHLHDPSYPLDASGSEMAGVRAIQARLSAFRDPSGIRIFSTDSEMLLADDSVLNSDIFWSASPAQQISHCDTKEGLGAYYDIEHKFFRTAVVLWRNEDVGSVMLKRSSGAADVMRHLSLVAAAHPCVVKMLSPDAVDPVLDDALLLLEAPKKTWRKVYGREAARDALATLVLRIAACRGADSVCTRVLEALRD